ncbi:mucin-desulfating sulfatase (N-acetylglucosamine-6-sulfatase) [Rhodopirellula maiorica SM1]|uniref:Mucin-desulfating sulfatase (N-acetylglucosamine-6-sulfatase) n=2 Tax=Novipirellula TaxID=2795426 RepID=M5RD80_9BACT|nr:mucin-desulfating sulfatase (N-acetylglucosamine-6-sulfatase) [Rhodopirellula maiorica SM1]
MVGRIREQLDREGLADNTVIVFASDHGIMNGEFGLGGKALNYESCLRVPLIIMDPRVAPSECGRRSNALVESVDIAPTLLDCAGVELPRGMQGHSLRGIIEGTEDAVRSSSFAENLWSTQFGNPRIESVRTDDGWKYIRYFKNDRSLFEEIAKKKQFRATPKLIASYHDWLTASINGEEPVFEELYHLATDPSESVNLATRPTCTDKLHQLRAECQRLVTFAKGEVEQAPATVVIDQTKGRKAQ